MTQLETENWGVWFSVERRCCSRQPPEDDKQFSSLSQSAAPRCGGGHSEGRPCKLAVCSRVEEPPHLLSLALGPGCSNKHQIFNNSDVYRHVLRTNTITVYRRYYQVSVLYCAASCNLLLVTSAPVWSYPHWRSAHCHQTRPWLSSTAEASWWSNAANNLLITHAHVCG